MTGWRICGAIIQSLMDPQEDFSDLYTSSPISYSQEYSDVPLPDAALSPYLLAARWQAHDLYVEAMPRVAADLLEAGHDTPSLFLLATLVSDLSTLGYLFLALGRGTSAAH